MLNMKIGGLVLYVVVFAMIAAFLALRLYGVLGKRTGQEQQPLPRAAEERAAVPSAPRTVDAVAEVRESANRNIDTRAEQGLRAIVAGEPGLDVGQFLQGAKGAYRMTLEAFWKGDEQTLAELAEQTSARHLPRRSRRATLLAKRWRTGWSRSRRR